MIVQSLVDELGRVIVVRQLEPDEADRIVEYTAGINGYEQYREGRIPHRLPFMIAASVRMINEENIPFPRNRGELDAIYDRLDIKGLVAATAAYAKLCR